MLVFLSGHPVDSALVRAFLALTFGLNLILGNICMMQVAYAAEDLPHEHSSLMHCSGTNCSPLYGVTKEQRHAHVSCTDEECQWMKSPESVGTIGNDEIPDTTAAPTSPLILQALLVIGAPLPTPSYQETTVHEPPGITVVLMQ
jgi:hypothetical protein